MTLKLLKYRIFGVKTARYWHVLRNVKMNVITLRYYICKSLVVYRFYYISLNDTSFERSVFWPYDTESRTLYIVSLPDAASCDKNYILNGSENSRNWASMCSRASASTLASLSGGVNCSAQTPPVSCVSMYYEWLRTYVIDTKSSLIGNYFTLIFGIYSKLSLLSFETGTLFIL